MEIGIGELIETRRRELGISLDHIAETATRANHKLDKTTLWNLIKEGPKTLPSVAKVHAIAAGLELHVPIVARAYLRSLGWLELAGLTGVPLPDDLSIVIPGGAAHVTASEAADVAARLAALVEQRRTRSVWQA